MDGEPVTGFISSKALALVFYLATTGRPHTRETLAGLLWGEFPQENARKNLRDVLSNLRRLVAGHVNITRQEVAFERQAPYSLDSEAFLEAIARIEEGEQETAVLSHTTVTSLREAVDLYQGDFLEGFYVPQAPDFEEWMLVERRRLRHLALQALHRLLRHLAQQDDYMPGINYATRLLALEPWHEEAHRLLMRMLAWSGRRSAALAQYKTCCRVLQDELGVEPQAETTTLYRQIVAGEVAPRTAETAAAASRPLHNLPAQLTGFVGRELELQRLLAQLREPDCRLLTLVGAGGIGKTRLALQAAEMLLPQAEAGQQFRHGIYFVSLASLETADFDPSATEASLAAAIADALKLSFSGSEQPVARLQNYLREKEMLLVIDNFEHLVPAATILAELLQRAPALKLLVTSRGRLNVRGEHILQVGGLEYPLVKTADPHLWQSYSAVQLFLQTAQTIDPEFSLRPQDEAAVIRICRLVEGLPLGVELAATWVRMLSCTEIAREIEQNLGFLEATMHDMPARHRSLRAVFEYSWNLLTARQQETLCRLSVFRGPFAREAAVEVAAASLPLLTALVDSSLVRRVVPEEGPVGYEMLEVLRQYAAEKLAQSQPVATQTRDRHSAYYLAFLQERLPALQGGEQQKALNEVGAQIENIRAAWRWAVQQGDVAGIDGALQALFHFYDMRSWFQEGADLFQQAVAGIAILERSPQNERVAARLLARQGWFTFHLGRQTAAQALLAESLERLRPLRQPATLIFPLNYLGAVNYHLGAYQRAQQLCHESLTLSQALGERYGAAIALNILGQISHRTGNYDAARDYCRQSLAIEQAINNRWSMTFSFFNLGRVAYETADYQEATRLFQESLQIREEIGDLRGMGLCLHQLAQTAVAQGAYSKAHSLYQRSLATFREIGNQSGMITALTGLGNIARHQSDYASAKAYYDDALRRAQTIHAVPSILDVLQEVATLCEQAGPPEMPARLHHFIHRATTQELSSQSFATLIEETLSTAIPT